MSLANSSLKKRSKPDKPSPDFPLTASGNGQWVRRINIALEFWKILLEHLPATRMSTPV